MDGRAVAAGAGITAWPQLRGRQHSDQPAPVRDRLAAWSGATRRLCGDFARPSSRSPRRERRVAGRLAPAGERRAAAAGVVSRALVRSRGVEHRPRNHRPGADDRRGTEDARRDLRPRVRRARQRPVLDDGDRRRHVHIRVPRYRNDGARPFRRAARGQHDIPGCRGGVARAAGAALRSEWRRLLAPPGLDRRTGRVHGADRSRLQTRAAHAPPRASRACRAQP